MVSSYSWYYWYSHLHLHLLPSLQQFNKWLLVCDCFRNLLLVDLKRLQGNLILSLSSNGGYYDSIGNLNAMGFMEDAIFMETKDGSIRAARVARDRMHCECRPQHSIVICIEIPAAQLGNHFAIFQWRKQFDTIRFDLKWFKILNWKIWIWI